MNSTAQFEPHLEQFMKASIILKINRPFNGFDI